MLTAVHLGGVRVQTIMYVLYLATLFLWVYTTQIRSLNESVYTSVVADYVLNKTFNADTNAFKRVILQNSTSPVTGANANIFYFANISAYLNGATYNTQLQTLTNAGAQGNTFAIWNYNSGPNSNSYALLAGVIDVNNVQLGASYYANGIATGSNAFANLSLYSGNFPTSRFISI